MHVLAGAHLTRIDHGLPYHVHALLNTVDAVRQRAEVTLWRSPHRLLGAVENRVVSGHNGDDAVGQSVAQRLLVMDASNGRGHDELRRFGEVRVPHLGLVHGQCRGHRLPHHAVACFAGAGNLLHGVHAHDVHHVEGGVDEARQLDRAPGGLPLQNGWSGQSMPLRTKNALVDHELLSRSHSVAVLGVHLCQRSNLLALHQASHQLLVRHHERALVRHEKLEAVDSQTGQRRHVRRHLVVPLGHGHVEPVVHHGFLRFGLPGLEAGNQATFHGQGEVDVHGGASRQRCLLAAFEVVTRHLSHEGHLKVSVRIDPSWHHVLSLSVQHSGTFGRHNISSDSLDDSILQQHIRNKLSVVIHHCSALQ
mmetsp:Transcript_6884/g.13092  ORF Transcript_6884/g.13092 Transcript_6884/m.13092 type:complete len:364 (+) Transcript_6884:895-1986(+)